jgi:hypothetical protein
MKKISIVITLMFSVIILKADNLKIKNQVTKISGLELKINHKKVLLEDGYYWFNFGGCWRLYHVENNHAMPMASNMEYIGNTVICNETAANVC